MRRQDYHESIGDSNLFELVRVWLEPFADGALPSIDLRRAILDALQDVRCALAPTPADARGASTRCTRTS